jgi:hypothetical protein
MLITKAEEEVGTDEGSRCVRGRIHVGEQTAHEKS